MYLYNYIKRTGKKLKISKLGLLKQPYTAHIIILDQKKRHELRIEKASLNLETIDVQTLDDRYIKKEEIENVRNTMNELREQDKKILILRYSGFKYKEIAEILGVEKSSIGTMLVRAQNKFKKIHTERKGR